MVEPLRRLGEVFARFDVRRRIARLFPDAVRRSYLSKYVVVLAIIVLLTGGVSVYFFGGISKTLDRQVDTEARATTQMHATIYSDWFDAREQTLQSLAELDYMAGGSLDRASRRLSLEAARSPIFTDIHLIALDSGDVLASSTDDAIGRSYYNTSLDESFVRDGRAFVYPERRTAIDGSTVVTLVVRMPTANRVLVTELNPASEPNPPQPVTGASTHIVTSEGAVIFGSKNATAIPANASRVVSVSRTDEALLSYRRLSDSNLYVVRTTPAQQAFGVKQDVLVTFLLTLVLNAGILVVVGLIAGRAATRDLGELVAKANSIASGTLDVDLSTDRRDELGDLYAAFADMRDALRQRIEESESARGDAQEARDEIEEQKAIISVLNRVLRHNLRNDLVVINGHTSILKDVLDDDTRKHATIIDSRADDLLDKAEKAREIERLVGDDQQLQPIDAVDILETEIKRFRREHPHVTIIEDVPGPILVQAHDALGFVFSNLIENAIEHNESPSPTVDVTIRPTANDSEWVAVEIADDGPGIPEPEVESLHMGYETAIKHGSGLGLWLVNWLVDEMGGSLEFERTDPRGTVVTVRLRAVAQESTVQSTLESA